MSRLRFFSGASSINSWLGRLLSSPCGGEVGWGGGVGGGEGGSGEQAGWSQDTPLYVAGQCPPTSIPEALDK